MLTLFILNCNLTYCDVIQKCVNLHVVRKKKKTMFDSGTLEFMQILNIFKLNTTIRQDCANYLLSCIFKYYGCMFR